MHAEQFEKTKEKIDARRERKAAKKGDEGKNHACNLELGLIFHTCMMSERSELAGSLRERIRPKFVLIELGKIDVAAVGS